MKWASPIAQCQKPYEEVQNICCRCVVDSARYAEEWRPPALHLVPGRAGGHARRQQPENTVPDRNRQLGAGCRTSRIALTDDGKRLAVTDYFLIEDYFGKIHFESDHKIRVIKVFKDHLELDSRFILDFNTTFPAAPARTHGVAMK